MNVIVVGYNTLDKTKIRYHINRKIICRPINSDVNLEDCRNFILDGLSYKEYCEKILNKKTEETYEKNDPNNSKNDPNRSKNDPNRSKNDPNRSKNDPIKCQFCERVYSNRSNLNKHLKKCKEKQKDDTVRESMEELVKLLNEKDKQLKEELGKKDKQIEELVKKAGLSTTNNNTNNITNNIQNNIKLLNYKETDTSHLTENDYVRCLEHYNFCVPHLIRKIHFNPKKPENHNIYISNLKNSYVMVYMNNKWKVKNRDETISRVIDDKQIILEKKIQEWVESGIQYPKVMAKFSRYLEKREENDVINAIKEDIKLMLYNNRNMIIENNKRLIK